MGAPLTVQLGDDVLEEKYRLPTKEHSNSYSDLAGAQREGAYLVWRGKDIWLTLEQYHGRFDISGITATTKRSRDAVQSQDAAKVMGAADKL